MFQTVSHLKSEILFLSLLMIFILEGFVVESAKVKPKPPKKKQSERCEGASVWQPLLYHKATQKCYEMGSKGPCPNNLYYFAIPFGGIYGDCDCPQPGDLIGDGNLFPNIYHRPTDKCYPIYTQAYCSPNQWLVYKDNVTVHCIENPCRDRVLQNVVYFDGKCVSLGSICGTGLYGIQKYVHLHRGNISPSCDEAYEEANKLSGSNFKCGKGQVLDGQGVCQPVVELIVAP